MALYSPYSLHQIPRQSFGHLSRDHVGVHVPGISLSRPQYIPKNHYTIHEMYNPREQQYNQYLNVTENSTNKIPNLDVVLRTQVQDFITMGLEKQVSEVSTTKENTKILKNWLKMHRNNPYPSKTEKVMLAYSTRMTLTQISNWFANARRRIKQEKRANESIPKLPEPTNVNKESTQGEISTLNNNGTVSGSSMVTSPESINFDSSLNETNISPDSGLESFNLSNGSLEKVDNGGADQKGLKCKTNLFGVDPSPEIKVRPLEVTDVPQKKEKVVQKSSKIWSVTDILNTK